MFNLKSSAVLLAIAGLASAQGGPTIFFGNGELFNDRL